MGNSNEIYVLMEREPTLFDPGEEKVVGFTREPQVAFAFCQSSHMYSLRNFSIIKEIKLGDIK